MMLIGIMKTKVLAVPGTKMEVMLWTLMRLMEVMKTMTSVLMMTIRAG